MAIGCFHFRNLVGQRGCGPLPSGNVLDREDPTGGMAVLPMISTGFSAEL